MMTRRHADHRASGETGNGPCNLFNPSLHSAEKLSLLPLPARWALTLVWDSRPSLMELYLPPILNSLKSLLLSPTKWVYYMVSRACQHPPQHSLLFIPAPLSLLLCTPAWSDLLFPWPVLAGLRIYYLGQFYKSFTVNFSHVHLLPLQLDHQTSKPCLIYHRMPTTSCTVPNASEISISISRFILKTDKLTLCSHFCLYQVDLEQTKRNLAAFFPSDCTWSLAL